MEYFKLPATAVAALRVAPIIGFPLVNLTHGKAKLKVSFTWDLNIPVKKSTKQTLPEAARKKTSVKQRQDRQDKIKKPATKTICKDQKKTDTTTAIPKPVTQQPKQIVSDPPQEKEGEEMEIEAIQDPSPRKISLPASPVRASTPTPAPAPVSTPVSSAASSRSSRSDSVFPPRKEVKTPIPESRERLLKKLEVTYTFKEDKDDAWYVEMCSVTDKNKISYGKYNVSQDLFLINKAPDSKYHSPKSYAKWQRSINTYRDHLGYPTPQHLEVIKGIITTAVIEADKIQRMGQDSTKKIYR